MNYLKAWILALWIPVIILACAQIPVGADPVAFRLKEASLNTETFKAAIPGAGYPKEDEARLIDVANKVEQALDAASVAYKGGGDPLDTLEATIPILQKMIDQIDSEQARTNGQRFVATLNVTVSVLKNQKLLKEEFTPAVP